MLTQLERFIYELKTFSQVPIDRDELIHILDMVHSELMVQYELYDRLYDEYEELVLDINSLVDTISDLEDELRELNESQEDE